MKTATFIAYFAFIVLPSVQHNAPRPGIPKEAIIIETHALISKGHPHRSLILWMLNPSKHPTDYEPDDPYTCPDQTRGSHFSGPTRVSLLNTQTQHIINTIEIKSEYAEGEDTFDIPYAIRKGYYYRVKAKPNVEAKPNIIWLRDYNADGKPLEFALFDALACMGLQTTLIGYSETQDKVIQYPIKLTIQEEAKQSTEVEHWVDYLFSKKPFTVGYWKYEVDYRGRGGTLDKYEIRYNAAAETFEGKVVVEGSDR